MATRTLAALATAAAWLTPVPSVGGVPDWLREAARLPTPDSLNAEGVCLLDERRVDVSRQGDIEVRQRRAYRILKPEGRDRGTVWVDFDDHKDLRYLKAWSLPAGEEPYEVKEKHAVETPHFSGALYDDTRLKTLQIPAADPGNVVGYEYRTKEEPFVLEDTWNFVQRDPVLTATYTLALPGDWSFEEHWLHHPMQESTASPHNVHRWNLDDVPAVVEEPLMPPWQAVTGRMVVTILPSASTSSVSGHASWQDLGRWYSQLVAPRRQTSPAIQQTVAELTARATNLIEKLEALAAFVQRDVRYVAIEIGIGGYQPHSPVEVFENRYGDCKDKSLLLHAMLAEIGIESRLVLIHTDRGVLVPQVPSMQSFNHVILAIQLPPEVPDSVLSASVDIEPLGRLLFFDATDPWTPLGDLPASLQANSGLVVTQDGGVLLELPLSPPATNRVRRVGRFTLTGNGTLSGELDDTRWGAWATTRRQSLRSASGAERAKKLEDSLTSSLSSFELQSTDVENLETFDDSLTVHYHLLADGYAKQAGHLLLVRPLVLAGDRDDYLETLRREDGTRAHPVEFSHASAFTDVVEIRLPAGYRVDEVPPRTDVHTDFAEYTSETMVVGDTLRYSRTYTIKSVWVEAERIEELEEIYRTIASDQRGLAVLQKHE